MTRVAAYCRVSTDTRDQLHSFESQKRYFREYIEHHPEWTLSSIYADEGITGTSTRGRDGFNRLIADAKRGLFELVITKEVSRFSRNILDAIAFTRLLKSLGIGVIFMSDGISTLEPDAELRLSIMASVAQEESRKTSERVKWGQSRQMERGVVFGRSLLGYDVVDGKMMVEPQGAAVVRKIFSMFVNERMGTRAIAERLTRMGIETKTGRTVWSPASILKIIKNEKYCGDLLQKKTITKDYLTHRKSLNPDKSSQILIKDHHEPVVDRALWDQAQAERRRRTPVGCITSKHGNRYALSGKIGCAECAAVFVCRTRKRQDGTSYRVWQSTCGHSIRQLREDWLGCCMREVVASCREQVLAVVQAVLISVPEDHSSSLSSILAELRRLARKNGRLADAYISGDISRNELATLREQYRQQAAQFAEDLRQFSRPAEEGKAALLEAARALIDGTDEVDSFYLRMIYRVEVHDDRKVTIFVKNLEEGRRFYIN